MECKLKTPKDYINLSFRASDLEEPLKARAQEQTNRGYTLTLKEDVRAYYALLRLCLPPFTHREWQVLRSALHGWLATPETVHLLWVEVADSCDDMSFVARLRSLSRFEAWAIVDRIRHEEEEK